jgi:hypothetical protein
MHKAKQPKENKDIRDYIKVQWSIKKKIINRNTVKVSYRCMPNMGQVIARHNSKVAKQEQVQQPPPGCNCRGGPATCPVDAA